MSRNRVYLFAAAAAMLVAAVIATGANSQNYVIDTSFKATSLAGWHVLGNADWKAQNGEYVGTPKSEDGGWLVLDKSYQDVGVFGTFKCTGGCKTGILVRAEKTNTGMKGIYIALAGEEVAAYAVQIDENGKETSREKLRAAGGQIRFAPPAPPPGAAGRGGRGAGGRGRGATPAGLPLTAPNGSLRENDWNQVEIILDATIIRPFLNESPTAGSAVEDAMGSYGPVALHIAGSGQVSFKDVGISDLGVKVLPNERVSSQFRMQRINDFYYGWGADVADINKDGINDIVSGPYYYLGPDYTKSREIYLAQTVNPSTEYPNDCMQTFAYDVTGDGWPDVLHMGAIGQPLHLYVNPQGQNRRWAKYDVVPQVQKEVSLFYDIDGDGKPEFIYGGGGFLRYAKPDPENPTKEWKIVTISEQGPWGMGHGLGVGDINGDGKKDIVDPYGWFEQPKAGADSGLWTYHPQAFGKWTGHASPGAGETAVYDVNGDGLADVVTVLQSHGWGISWFEQKRDKASGNISWVEHVIASDLSHKNPGGFTTSELHGSTVADVDGDGIPDYIVGKRYWSHRDDYTDPDPYGTPAIYYYRTVRNPKAPGGAEFIPELIHNRSGGGNAISAVDINKDGRMDIITATDRGLFVFWGKPKAPAAAR